MSKFKVLVENVLREAGWEIQPDMFGGDNRYYRDGKKALTYPEIRNFIVDNFPSFDYVDSSDNGVIEKLVFEGNGSVKEEDVKKALENKFGNDIRVRVGHHKYAPEIKSIEVAYLMEPDEDNEKELDDDVFY